MSEESESEDMMSEDMKVEDMKIKYMKVGDMKIEYMKMRRKRDRSTANKLAQHRVDDKSTFVYRGKPITQPLSGWFSSKSNKRYNPASEIIIHDNIIYRSSTVKHTCISI